MEQQIELSLAEGQNAQELQLRMQLGEMFEVHLGSAARAIDAFEQVLEGGAVDEDQLPTGALLGRTTRIPTGGSADLTVDLSLGLELCVDGMLQLIATVYNAGSLGVPAGVDVTFYEGQDATGVELMTLFVVPVLYGAREELRWRWRRWRQERAAQTASEL